jgi:hypothetical protein
MVGTAKTLTFTGSTSWGFKTVDTHTFTGSFLQSGSGGTSVFQDALNIEGNVAISKGGSDSSWIGGHGATTSGSGPAYPGGLWVNQLGPTVSSVEGAPNGTLIEGDLGVGVTNYLLGSRYNKSIPADALITGFTLDVIKRGKSDGRPTVDNAVYISKDVTGGDADNFAGTNKADVSTLWGTTLATASYGGPNDLWGQSWSVADVEATSFGVCLQANNTHGASECFLDAIQITCHYAYATTCEITGGLHVTGTSANVMTIRGLPSSDPVNDGQLYYLSGDNFGGSADVQVLCISTGSG